MITAYVLIQAEAGRSAEVGGRGAGTVVGDDRPGGPAGRSRKR